STSDLQIPAGTPITCIQTFENDLWYELIPADGISWYQVDVMPYECSTPAGLQGMIISGSDCDAGTFDYLDCANPRETGNLSMFASPDFSEGKIWIYIDGYDGTECGFKLTIRGFDEDPRTVDDIRQATMDYDSPPPYYEPLRSGMRFENNVAVIFWEDESHSSTSAFQVQRCYRYNNRLAGTIIGTLEPKQTVGAETDTYYEFVDQRGFREGAEYCYRIVRIDDRGARAYSEPVCEEAILVDEFWVSEVFESDQPGSYQVQYNVRKKQTLRFILENEDGEELKSLIKKKEPKGDGIVTIDMSEYEPGSYALRVIGDTGSYFRVFFREP
ncbi:MAG: hypothetical protein AAGM67_17075, partial [Bacteroidota bacterium]